MTLSEVAISTKIIDSYRDKLVSVLDLDVAVAGAGPSGLIAAALCAREGKKVAVFEKRMSTGGGIWAGGMMFNEVVVQESALRILDDFSIDFADRGDGMYSVDAVALASGLTFGAVRAGAVVMNLIQAEDIMMREKKVTGLVINWTTTEMAGLGVDPLVVKSSITCDATGHEADIVSLLVSKGITLDTPGGGIEGEQAMWADDAEKDVVSNTGEVFPGLYVMGMSANAVFGGHRMGAVFGGMLLSGEKAALEILEKA